MIPHTFLLSLQEAAPPPGDRPADTAWMLIATALVLLMTPALAFFYGGLVRSKNSLNTMMMSFVALGVVGLVWALLAYSLAFAAGGLPGSADSRMRSWPESAPRRRERFPTFSSWPIRAPSRSSPRR